MKPIDKKSHAHRIVQEELQLLGWVTSMLSEISVDNPGAPDYDDALINLRDQLAEAKPEDIAALVEQMSRVSAIAQRYGRGRDLPIDLESPYFAHLGLEEQGGGRDVMIGKRGFIDRKRKVQIVDWRNAPVSRIYYRYDEGDDYEERFANRALSGKVSVRRTLTIEAGQLRRVGCPQGTFVHHSDGTWHEAPASAAQLSGGQGTAARPPAALKKGDKRSRLGSAPGAVRADKHLPEIAALIDPPQFELITRPESGLVVLQGGAGTGKTTVALHRVAYLNFAAPKRFRADRMLVVVPTRAMVRYVERVLPSLGVGGVRVMTTRDWFRRTRLKVLPRSSRLENDDTPALVLRFKKHPFLLALAREVVARQTIELTDELVEAIGATPEGDRIVAQWQALASRPLLRRIARLRHWLDGQQLSALTLQQADGTLRRMSQRARDVFEDWAEMLSDPVLLGRAIDEHCPGAFNAREIEQVSRWCARQAEEPTPAHDRDDEDDERFRSLDGKDERELTHAGRMDPPDDALLLYLHQLKQGGLRPPGGNLIEYEHLVADEAQDLCPIELRVLLESTTAGRSVTLAGDSQQRLVFDNHFSSWETLLSQLGVTAASNATLRLGYRSTAEVMALAQHLLGELAMAEQSVPVRSGAPVELHRFGGQGEAVAMLADGLRSLASREPLASVALVSRHRAQAQAYAEALRRAEVPAVRFVDNDFSFRPGIEVTDVGQVKGLEFDYVVLLDVNATNYPESTESRHLLHIAATRAAHQLWLIATGRPSPVLPEGL